MTPFIHQKKRIAQKCVILILTTSLYSCDGGPYYDLGEEDSNEPHTTGSSHEHYPSQHFGGYSETENSERIEHENGLVEIKSYNSEGVLYSTEFYRHNRRDSVMTLWYENGKKMQENQYHDGFLQGWSYMWFRNGELKSEEYYDRGESRAGYVLYGSEDHLDYCEFYIDNELVDEDTSMRGMSVKKFHSQQNVPLIRFNIDQKTYHSISGSKN